MVTKKGKAPVAAVPATRAAKTSKATAPAAATETASRAKAARNRKVAVLAAPAPASGEADGRKLRSDRGEYAPHTREIRLVLSPEELARPGAMLLVMLYDEANRRNQNLVAMAHELDCTPGYLNQLRRGGETISGRDLTHIADKFVNSCARYLNVPRLTVLLACEKITKADFYEEPNIQMYLEPALRYIQRDVAYGGFLPLSAFKADPALQQFLIILFEDITKRTLLPGRVQAEDILSSIEALSAQRDKALSLVKTK